MVARWFLKPEVPGSIPTDDEIFFVYLISQKSAVEAVAAIDVL